MSNQLFYQTNVSIAERIPITKVSRGLVDATTIQWSSSNEALATVNYNGNIIRNLDADTGTVTISVTGLYLASNTTGSGFHLLPFRGDIVFELVPLADLPPVKIIPILIPTEMSPPSFISTEIPE